MITIQGALPWLSRAASSSTTAEEPTETKIAIGGYITKKLNTQEVHKHFSQLMALKNASGVEYRFGKEPTLPHMLIDSGHYWKLLDPKPGDHVNVTHETPQGPKQFVLSKTNPSAYFPPGEFFSAKASNENEKIICCVEQFNEGSLRIKDK